MGRLAGDVAEDDGVNALERFGVATIETRLAFARAARGMAKFVSSISDQDAWPLAARRLDYRVRLLSRKPRHLPRRINGRLLPLRRKG